MGWEGKVSSPGHPGTYFILPKVPKSRKEASETIVSLEPLIQSTGGFGSTREKPETSQYFGEMALFMPRLPGATRGQFREVVVSPGWCASPVWGGRGGGGGP